MDLTGKVKQKALDLGFDLVGITDAGPISQEHKNAFNSWLDAGYAGHLDFLRNNMEKRFDPSLLFPGAKSVIVVALNYKPHQPPPSANPSNPTGRIVSYACYQDYHTFIKNLLRKLAEFITTLTDSAPKFNICVDSTPIAERALAVKAGLGFIGKNHMLINPVLGPQIFLGEIVTTLQLDTDSPIDGSCGNCDKCLRACPTECIKPDGFLNISRCFNYLTIEVKEDIDGHLAEKLGNRLFGCDECILSCPYHKAAPLRMNKKFRYYPELTHIDLKEFLEMTGSDFDAQFADSPIKHTGLERLKRNAKICLANVTSRK